MSPGSHPSSSVLKNFTPRSVQPKIKDVTCEKGNESSSLIQMLCAHVYTRPVPAVTESACYCSGGWHLTGSLWSPLQLTGDTQLAVPAAFQDVHGLILVIDQK